MENKLKIYNKIAGLVLFIIMPILFYFLSDFPKKTVLKEAISILTVLAFFMMLMLFYLSRSYSDLLKVHHMNTIIKWHKIIGYGVICLFLLHPFFIIFPRFFESGIDPKSAFISMLFDFEIPGIIYGLIAWGLMIIIGITSYFQKSFRISYKNWRTIHAVLALLFILLATLHVLGTGKHINTSLFFTIVFIVSGGILLLLRTYLFNAQKNRNE